MLMNICLLRSRLPFSCRGNCNLKRPVPVPRYPMTSLDLILMGFHLHASALKLRYVHAPLLRSTDGEFPRKKNIIYGADVIDVRPFSARSFASASTYPCSPLTPTPLVSSSTLIRGPWSGPSPPYLTSPSPLSLATTTNTNIHVSTPVYDDHLHRAKSTYRGSA